MRRFYLLILCIHLLFFRSNSWGAETLEETEERILRAIDRLEVEGWIDSSDLAVLREAAEFPRSNCSLLDAWIDESACPEESQTSLERREKSIPWSFRWREMHQSDGTQDLRWAGAIGESRSSAGELGLRWRGEFEERPWKERGAVWAYRAIRLVAGQERFESPVGRGAPLRRSSKEDGESWRNPGGSLPDGFSLQWSPVNDRFRGEAFCWRDHYTLSDGALFGFQLWEAGISGRLDGGKKRWWLSGGAECLGSGDQHCRPEIWGGWQSGAVRLWSSWSSFLSSLPGGDSEENRSSDKAPSWQSIAASAVVQSPRHRMELVAAGREWGSATWRLSGASNSIEEGYRVRRGPFLSMASRSTAEWKALRGDLRWGAWRADSLVKWRSVAELSKKRGAWQPGISLALSGSGTRGYHSLRGELRHQTEKEWLVSGRFGPAWRNRFTPEGELWEEMFDSANQIEWPSELGWENRHFAWKVRWRDLLGTPDVALLEHQFRWRSEQKEGVGRGELFWRLLWPLGGEVREAQLRLEFLLLLGSR